MTIIGNKRGLLTCMEKAKIDNAKSFLADGLSIEQVARRIKLSLEIIRKLKSELSATQEYR